MKRILFPTDFSEAANNALNIAIHLAKQVDAEIFVLHSLNSAQQYVDISLSTAGDLTMPGMQPEVVLAAMEEEKKRVSGKMDALIETLKGQKVKVSHQIVQQGLEHVLNEITESEKIDFIVMGTHGSSGLREAFIGTNAQKIVRIANIPVLTVNEKCDDFTIKKIVYCSDFTESQINEQLPRVKKFAEIFDAKLEMVYINTPTYFEETKTVNQRMREIMEQYNLPNVGINIYNAFDIDEGVIDFAKEQDANVISIITHGYRGVKKLFSDNITESVVNHSEIPVLTLHIH